MILRAEGLTRRYGDHQALGGVSLAVRAGEVVALVGPNGAGKSTLFRLLSGLERPDAGAVFLGDQQVTEWPLHRRARAGLAYLPQGPSVIPELSAWENLALVTDAPGAALARVGLARLESRRAGQLSGGERRRLELARVWAASPRVVLLDEPLAGVDPAHRQEVLAQVRALAEAGAGVLLCDHAADEALAVAQRVVSLEAGVVVAAREPASVASRRA